MADGRCAGWRARAEPLRHGYPKKHRIRKRPEYLHMATVGKRLFSRHFILVYTRGEQLVSRLGVTVTKKIGHAVTRNRLKRVCREYFRTHKDEMEAVYDVHIIARSASAQAANAELTKSLEKLFSQIECGQTGSGDRRPDHPAVD